LAGRVLPGELIQWSGQPGLGILFEPSDILLVPFSLIWGGFAIFWETMALTRARAPLSLQLWGVPFVLAGLFIIFGRFLLDAHIRARLIYAITDRRIDWKWYRDQKLFSETRRCRMHFTDSPYTLWTWRRARDIGPGHYRVDTLIDDHDVLVSQLCAEHGPEGGELGRYRRGPVLPRPCTFDQPVGRRPG